VARLAERWCCSRQEVLKMPFRAVLPAMRGAGLAEELFDQVREALENGGTGVRFPETIWLGGP
jgi:ribosomal protein S18 acetylase RimI-like enzyme